MVPRLWLRAGSAIVSRQGKIVKATLTNRIVDEFTNDCIVCFVEQQFLATTIPTNDVKVRFYKMEDCNRT